VKLLPAISIALLLITGSANAANDLMAARSDRYDVQWGSISLGVGTIRLQPMGDNCYAYESTTDPVTLVRWTYGAPSESSQFCIVDGEVRPQRFAYQNDKRKKDNFSLEFDWKTRTVRRLSGGTLSQRELPALAYDRFVIREAVRLWVMRLPDVAAKPGAGSTTRPEAEFTMVDDDRIKTYRFAVTGREQIETAAGRFDTLRVERVDDPRKSYRYWLAPARGYVPVKIEHLKDGKVELRMNLLKD
jgi:hypothetical protein